MRPKKHASSAATSSDLMVEKKKKKVVGTRRRKSSNGVDLISELPDHVIHHILSYLDITTVIQTSFLSKRWRYLWTTLPFLNFDDDVYDSSSFWEIINDYDDDDDDDEDMEPHLRLQIPAAAAAAAASLICLPALKTLHLQGLKLMNSDVELLISRSLVLETLIMNYCILDSQELNICNNQIKSLTIEKMSKVDSHPYEFCEIKVFAPKLMSFSCTDYIGYINRYSFVNNSSLVKAEIDVDLRLNDSNFMVKSRKNAIDCLRGICNVRSLMLSTWFFEFVSEVPDRLESLQIHPFCNLSYLKLKTSLSKPQIAAITYLLEKCPNLEHLVLKVTDVYFYGNKKKVECWEAKLAPQCMMHHLKLIEIWDVKASVNELEFLRFLLNNAVVLEKMIVFTSKQQIGGFRKKLISFRGASSSSEIVFRVRFNN